MWRESVRCGHGGGRRLNAPATDGKIIMKKKRILIVDDEVSFTRLLKLNLEQTDDYEVRIENGCERVVKTAREFRPDLILLDVVMPGMFGNEVADRLRADAEVRTTPVVFLSAALGKKSVQANHGCIGGYPFIAKPASLNEIVEGIENSLVAPLQASAAPRFNPVAVSPG
jgi:DNA-binding response OmpR family regulator